MSGYKVFIVIFLSIASTILFLFYEALTPKKVLPIFQPNDVNYELVDSSIHHVKRFHKIKSFEFLNQNGEIISEKDYEGFIYVADFFFTTCPSICPIMTNNMVNIQNYIKDKNKVKLLSFSVTPEIDSVPVLKEYSIKKGVDDKYWNLLTGDKSKIYSLARKSFLVVKENRESNSHDMIHTENFVLVDREKRIRGFYDGTDDTDMQILKKDIEILLEVYN
ncbi:MAG: SCO family protein [Flavobacteriaceae bacterium]|tara:strand:- start:11468 stop:12127 length:660 start_codon:yes stop_codon:yes gene_type:complete